MPTVIPFLSSALKSDITWVILCMLFTGTLGGGVTYAFSANGGSRRGGLGWDVVVGIGASLLIPLFLQTVSSDLLGTIFDLGKAPGDKHKAYFVFFSFCLVAAISARAFIGKLTDKVLDMLAQVGKKSDEALKSSQEAKEQSEAVRKATVAQLDGLEQTGPRPTHKPQSDPLKKQYGGRSESNNRRIEATIQPLSTSSGWCAIRLRVLSTDPAKPLKGSVSCSFLTLLGTSKNLLQLR
jgi:hypothetical protein